MPNTTLGFLLSGRFLGGYTHFFCCETGAGGEEQVGEGTQERQEGAECKVKAALGLPCYPSREERTHSAYLKTGGI